MEKRKEFLKIIPKSIIYFVLYFFVLFHVAERDNLFAYLFLIVLTVVLSVYVFRILKQFCNKKLYVAMNIISSVAVFTVICACVVNIVMLTAFDLDFIISDVEFNNLTEDSIADNYMKNYRLTEWERKDIEDNPDDYLIVTVTGEIKNSHSYAVGNLRFGYNGSVLDSRIQRNPDSYNDFYVLPDDSVTVSVPIIVKYDYPTEAISAILISDGITIKGFPVWSYDS